MKTLRHILCRTVIAVLPCALPAVAQTQAPKRTPAVAKVTVPGASQEQAQSTQVTIYKLVDDRGHVTYSNRPMKGAEVVDLEPITVIPNGPRQASSFQQAANIQIQPQPAGPASQGQSGATLATAVASASGANSAAPSTTAPQATQLALVQPISATVLPNVETALQQKRDDSRRRILEEEMKAEQKALADSVLALSATESDRTVIEQMRLAATKQTPSAYAEARRNYEQREEKLRTLQESVNTHEKNVVALKKELAALR